MVNLINLSLKYTTRPTKRAGRVPTGEKMNYFLGVFSYVTSPAPTNRGGVVCFVFKNGLPGKNSNPPLFLSKVEIACQVAV